MRCLILLVLLGLTAGCSRPQPNTVPDQTPDAEPKAAPKSKVEPNAKRDPKPEAKSKADPEGKLPAVTISDAEAKAAAAVNKPGWIVTVDERYPEKPVIGLFVPYLTFDESTAATVNDLKHLRTLGGYDAKFKPGFFKSIKSHPALETIALGGGADSATVKELPDGPPIKELRLQGATLTSDDFAALASVPSLRSINVRLDGTKPTVLRPLHKAKALEALAVDGFEPLTAEDVGGFAGLKELKCLCPAESDAFFEAVAKLKHLRSLRVAAARPASGPEGVVTGAAKLATLTDLATLRIDSPVGDANLKALSSLKNLEVLSFYTDGVTAEGIKALKAFPKLTSLQLYASSRRDRSLLSDDAFNELKGVTGLTVLQLPYGQVSDAGATAIASLANLEVLDLTGMKSSADKVAPHIAKLQKLRELNLAMSDLTDTGLKDLANLKELATLKTGGTRVSPSGVAALKQALPKLKVDSRLPSSPN